MQPTLFDQGLMLMLVGMGTVIVFLSILVGAMSVMGLLVQRYMPSKDPAQDVSDEEIAAITIAIAQHKNIQP